MGRRDPAAHAMRRTFLSSLLWLFLPPAFAEIPAPTLEAEF
jgi:hypothetical protein